MRTIEISPWPEWDPDSEYGKMMLRAMGYPLEGIPADLLRDEHPNESTGRADDEAFRRCIRRVRGD